ncbi:non-specific lipid-transfer protein 1-like [Vicia villosa]|uniref:non-specific lipid-transfer protein 1-like n=1 Tax=Vicia villosa TaxID=3911 RepID=UPI00273AFDC0|nr:non-specific lipid-transfer protein 1-like [Vicia villosa]
MASSMFVKLTCMAMICLVLVTPLADAALSCGQIQLTVAPCIGYLRRPGPSVPAPCCNGVRSVNNQAKTVPDRQGVCSCLKSTTLSLPGLNLPALAALPAKCGVNLPYKISPSIDCNTVKY